MIKKIKLKDKNCKGNESCMKKKVVLLPNTCVSFG